MPCGAARGNQRSRRDNTARAPSAALRGETVGRQSPLSRLIETEVSVAVFAVAFEGSDGLAP